MKHLLGWLMKVSLLFAEVVHEAAQEGLAECYSDNKVCAQDGKNEKEELKRKSFTLVSALH